MSQFGNLYSQYYDLLYSDKNYEQEVTYVYDLIQQYNSLTQTVLDMGCGTGRHAELLSDKGFIVHGIDMSEDMLKIANTRRVNKEESLTFSHTSIQDLKLSKRFDTIISLFHVMSYQSTNDELIKAFEVVKSHLSDDGIFIFDFWYGPAVLTDLPTTRVKRLENDAIKVSRVAEPILHAQENIVDVNYNVFLENKQTQEIVEKKELHKMRYFFDTELELICQQVDLKIEKKLEWLGDKNPDFKSWNVVWILRK